MSRPSPFQSVLFLELNEADDHFLQKFCAQGKLPAFSRLLDEGAKTRTCIPRWDAAEDRAWRHISPWIIWPSIYTGLRPDEHELVAFGQDNAALRGRCVWDVLAEHNVTTGVFGCLHSYPPRNHETGAFYLPESLANDAACFPDSLRALQELFVFGARNYSGSFMSSAAGMLSLLNGSRRAGVRGRSMARTVAQIPLEHLRGERQVPERAMLHSYLSWDSFRHLYQQHRPRYAALHLNHIAYMQHRYWRAAEPGRFSDRLGPADAGFFATVAERNRSESVFAQRIERSFVFADKVVAQLMEMCDPSTLLLVGTGLGQRPMDPVSEIHNPVVRVDEPEALFRAFGLSQFEVLHQMNPDLTVNFSSQEEARRGSDILSALYIAESVPLFDVAHSQNQVFLELRLPAEIWTDSDARIRSSNHSEVALRWDRFIRLSGHRDQSTAHHHDRGLLLGWNSSTALTGSPSALPVTDIAPNILTFLGVPVAEWMNANAMRAFSTKA
jgi:hypothetical protein